MEGDAVQADGVYSTLNHKGEAPDSGGEVLPPSPPPRSDNVYHYLKPIRAAAHTPRHSNKDGRTGVQTGAGSLDLPAPEEAVVEQETQRDPAVAKKKKPTKRRVREAVETGYMELDEHIGSDGGYKQLQKQSLPADRNYQRLSTGPQAHGGGATYATLSYALGTAPIRHR